jgi:hypothetical protein
MTTIPPTPSRPGRLLGLVTPLAVAVAVIMLLLLPNLIMHTGLRSNTSPAVSMLGSGTASQSAAAAVESPPVMR